MGYQVGEHTPFFGSKAFEAFCLPFFWLSDKIGDKTTKCRADWADRLSLDDNRIR